MPRRNRSKDGRSNLGHLGASASIRPDSDQDGPWEFAGPVVRGHSKANGHDAEVLVHGESADEEPTQEEAWGELLDAFPETAETRLRDHFDQHGELTPAHLDLLEERPDVEPEWVLALVEEVRAARREGLRRQGL